MKLFKRHERKAQGSFYCCPRAGRRRATAADQGQGSATSAREWGLAHRRTQDVGREEILSRQPAGEDRPAHLSGHHQGALDLRAGSPADERRTRSRSLRGTILARPSPACAYDDDRLRLPPASPPRSSKAGKKESAGHRRSRLCQPCATPSSNSSLNYRRSDARIAENGFATSRGVSKSAKVVLASVFQDALAPFEAAPAFDDNHRCSKGFRSNSFTGSLTPRRRRPPCRPRHSLARFIHSGAQRPWQLIRSPRRRRRAGLAARP